MSLYLDYNASTPLDRDVLESMMQIYTEYYGNSESRTHDYGLEVHKKVEEARKNVAELLNAAPNEVIFTSGATESDNMAILGLQEYGERTGKKHIVTTGIEHKAVLEPCRELQRRGFEVELIAPDGSGRVKSEDVLNRVRKDTLLVSVMHANNETGMIQPIKEIGEELDGKEVYFHVDAAQSCGKLVEELKNIRYDLLSLTGHKMYAPQGIGALIVKFRNYKKPPLKPLVFGGGHENGMRSGTLPTALICGLGKMCEKIERNHEEYWNNYHETRTKVLDILNASDMEYCLNGDEKYCLPNTINISFPKIDSEAFMIRTKKWCAISNGSACNAKSYDYSYVLRAMGLSEERMRSALRISWGKDRPDLREFQQMIDAAKMI